MTATNNSYASQALIALTGEGEAPAEPFLQEWLGRSLALPANAQFYLGMRITTSCEDTGMPRWSQRSQSRLAAIILQAESHRQ